MQTGNATPIKPSNSPIKMMRREHLIFPRRLPSFVYFAKPRTAWFAGKWLTSRSTGRKPATRVAPVTSDGEVQNLRNSGSLVLSQRNLESYLLSEDAISSLVRSLHAEEKLADALEIRTNALAASAVRGNPPDDVKSASGDIFVGLKRLLGLTRCGNSTDEFLRDTMAFHVKEGTVGYEDLKTQILDRLS